MLQNISKLGTPLSSKQMEAVLGGKLDCLNQAGRCTQCSISCGQPQCQPGSIACP